MPKTTTAWIQILVCSDTEDFPLVPHWIPFCDWDGVVEQDLTLLSESLDNDYDMTHSHV